MGQAKVPDGLAPIAQVSAGGNHTCTLTTEGTVFCWGYNSHGQATVPAGLASVAKVTTGSYHTCALKADRTLVCWGRNTHGQTTVPSGLASVSQVSAGRDHTCVVDMESTLVCWGGDEYGQATVTAGVAPVAEVSAGFYHTCAVRTSGRVICWGDNRQGQATVPVLTVGAITAPAVPVQVNTTLAASASFADPMVADAHTAVVDWGDGSSSAAIVTEASGSGSASGSHAYTTPGVYTVTLTVTDNDGASAQSVFEFVVAFDPEAGFVTGSGLINSPAGAYTADVSLAGRATFGFVSSYQKGTTVPSGNTRFQFHAGDFNFRSTAYDWLVIAGPQAKFKGSGTINGEGDFGFLLSAVDGDLNGGGDTDKFRIKIWDKVTGGVIYDNQTGTADDAAATTVIEGGNIVIHK